MDAVFPHYGFSSHVGYITPGHSAVVRPTRALVDPPPVVPGALLRRHCHGRDRGSRLNAARCGTTACAGYRILGVNVWSAGYELDLIARRGRRLVFCEVKSKSGSGFGLPEEMVGREKQRRLFQAAEAWLAQQPSLAGVDVEFEVLAVEGRELRRIPLGDPL
jgi:putative endonuclease